MSVTEQAVAVLLPGTGSDEVFVRDVFSRPLRAVGLRLCAPRPQPGKDLVKAYLAALDAAAADGQVIVGGISLGAHLAAGWALRNPDRCAGLLLALPAWSGCPTADTPAALAARYSAADVRARGTAAALASATAGVPGWLAAELSRAWTGYGSGLADALEIGAEHPAPALAELAMIMAPAGVAGCVDDPVHPVEVARSWTAALPNGRLNETRLALVGADPAALGRAAVQAWLRARDDH
ncbi:alpha/beta fold hydrolase [Actinokineospora enzanensis]|uniref:alpha/beta fold hydrolase n=1 Tax=Actinokineospora enzanensis TaxID=155975 RepID=UPI00036D87D0|nr:hypothetical protein [Actinokineospora enzanensis]